MRTSGTTLARSTRMNDRPIYPVTSLLSQTGQPAATRAGLAGAAAPDLSPDEARRAGADEGDDGGLDKYDISTLACTD